MAIVKKEQYRSNKNPKTKTKSCKKANSRSNTSSKKSKKIEKIMRSKKNEKTSASHKKSREKEKYKSPEAPREARKTKKLALAMGDIEKRGETGERVLITVLLLLYSDYQQVFAPAATYFRCYFLQ